MVYYGGKLCMGVEELESCGVSRHNYDKLVNRGNIRKARRGGGKGVRTYRRGLAALQGEGVGGQEIPQRRGHTTRRLRDGQVPLRPERGGILLRQGQHRRTTERGQDTRI